MLEGASNVQDLCTERSNMPLQWQDHQVTAHKSVRRSTGNLHATPAKETPATSPVLRSDYRASKLLFRSSFLESTSTMCSARQTSQESLRWPQHRQRRMSCVRQQSQVLTATPAKLLCRIRCFLKLCRVMRMVSIGRKRMPMSIALQMGWLRFLLSPLALVT